MLCTTAPSTDACAVKPDIPFVTQQYLMAVGTERLDKESVVKRILVSVFAIMALALTAISPVKADMTELEIIFVKGDQNGDLVLNKAEVLLIAITQFNLSDSDRDGMLEKQEVGDLASDPEFSDNDANKDGSLSIEEVITEKLADFKSADTNSDGVLTVIEVKKFYENKK